MNDSLGQVNFTKRGYETRAAFVNVADRMGLRLQDDES